MQDFDIRYVVGDEMRLTQVIINFVSNAIKFTSAGGTISITFRQMNKLDGKVHLMIRVRDTGIGIAPEFLHRIFKPFEQESASTAHHYGGSGLGMAIADRIIGLMDGEILV
jgi:signal transduction histidine kinase